MDELQKSWFKTVQSVALSGVAAGSTAIRQTWGQMVMTCAIAATTSSIWRSTASSRR